MKQELDMLVNRLNFDPVVYKGCTEKEIIFVALITALPLCAFFGFLGFLLWRNIFFGILIGGVLGVFGVFMGLNIMQRLKRDKEPGFLQQVVVRKFEQMHMLKTPIIRRHGPWMIGRYIKND